MPRSFRTRVSRMHFSRWIAILRWPRRREAARAAAACSTSRTIRASRRAAVRGAAAGADELANGCATAQDSVRIVDRRTLARWRRWWGERVGQSRVFEIGRAQFMPPPEATQLPLSLVESFVGTASERVLHAVHWLARQFRSRFPMEGGVHAELAR
jgi:hypothetical protein